MTLFVLLFVLGWITHLIAQAEASVRSKSNGLQSRLAWYKLNAHVIFVRAVLGAGSFLVWRESPQLFGEMMGRVFPMNLGTCILAGFCVDSFWDKATFIGGLKVEVPSLVPPKDGGQ